MAWIRMPGIEGLVYQPESDPSAPRKHDCTDCFVCQMCSDSRCVECRKQRAGDACHPLDHRADIHERKYTGDYC